MGIISESIGCGYIGERGRHGVESRFDDFASFSYLIIRFVKKVV